MVYTKKSFLLVLSVLISFCAFGMEGRKTMKSKSVLGISESEVVRYGKEDLELLKQVVHFTLADFIFADQKHKNQIIANAERSERIITNDFLTMDQVYCNF